MKTDFLKSNAIDHVWHVWINSEGEFNENRPTEMQLDPHKRGLYAFKSAMQLLPHLGKMITKDRLKSLPLVHQQCLHSAPESMEENHLACWLGQRLDSCPILKRLRAKFDEERKRPYYGEKITDEDVDHVAAMTCVWHLLMGQDGFVDWNEGAIQDSSDRQYWRRLYDNLASQ